MVPNIDSLLIKFKRAKLNDYPDVAKYKFALDAGLWVLWVHQTKLNQTSYLNAGDVSEILASSCGVSFSNLEISRAFARAGKRLDARRVGDKSVYKIMNKGIEYLRAKEGKGNVEVFLIEGDKPRTSHQFLKDVVAKTKGEMKILDPYYGTKSLDMLEKINNEANVKFLTARLGGGENASSLSRELSNFKIEHTNIELRKYPNPSALHDRYIITDDTLILLGHGLKDLGGKESFVLVFKNEIGEDIRTALDAKFEEKWRQAADLT